jgi:hypothetical protein
MCSNKGDLGAGRTEMERPGELRKVTMKLDQLASNHSAAAG